VERAKGKGEKAVAEKAEEVRVVRVVREAKEKL